MLKTVEKMDKNKVIRAYNSARRHFMKQGPQIEFQCPCWMHQRKIWSELTIKCRVHFVRPSLRCLFRTDLPFWMRQMGESPLLWNPSDGCGWSGKARVSQASGRVGVDEDASVPGSDSVDLSTKSCQLSTPFQVCHMKCSLQESLTVIEGGGECVVRVETLDSSDDETPFVVTRSAAAPRPSRRLVLVPESVNATQSIQDREWDRGASELSLIDRTLGSDRSLQSCQAAILVLRSMRN